VDLPSITIVTPCMNAAGTLEEALASVRGQHYPGDLEHVVVDGGSTDGSVEILERTPGIRYVSEPDRGLSDAMNKGVAMARGELVGWLNADDFYEPGALLVVGRALAARPEARWVTGRCRIVDGDGKEIRKAVTSYKNLLLRHYSFPLFLTQNFVSCPATFVRKDAWQEAGGTKLEHTISMDYDLFLRIGKRHDPLILARELAVFRMVEGTLSMSGFETQFREHAEQARAHGDGHPVPVAVNVLMSRAIVLVYRVLRHRRALASD
jgi:glycosyltransferase involved in cell wall biosynthesis